jgi:hypothetical protein
MASLREAKTRASAGRMNANMAKSVFKPTARVHGLATRGEDPRLGGTHECEYGKKCL